MFAATVQDSFDFGAGAFTGLYLTHLVGRPVAGDRFELAGATRLVTKLDDRRRTRECLTGLPLQGGPYLLIAVTPALDPDERQQATRRRRISTGPDADQSLGQRHPDAQHLRLGRSDTETAELLDRIRSDGLTAVLHPMPGQDIHSGQVSILLDADNEAAVVILTTHAETRRADDIPEKFLRRAGHAGLDEWRGRNPDLSDDTPILCHGFQLVEVAG